MKLIVLLLTAAIVAILMSSMTTTGVHGFVPSTLPNVVPVCHPTAPTQSTIVTTTTTTTVLEFRRKNQPKPSTARNHPTHPRSRSVAKNSNSHIKSSVATMDDFHKGEEHHNDGDLHGHHGKFYRATTFVVSKAVSFLEWSYEMDCNQYI